MKVFTSYSRHAEAARPPRHRRPGVLIAAAALIAAVGIVMSGAGEPGTAPGGTTGTSTPWSTRFSLIATGWWTPDPTAPPAAAPAPQAAAPEVAAPEVAAPPAAAPAPQVAAPPAAVPPPPPPPPPPELKLRQDHSLAAAFVSITNNADKPAVSCVYRAVAVTGVAKAVNWNDSVHFTVTGSQETKIKYRGPATGSTFHDTVTCDNGLSTSMDNVW
jgi:hypothetical protein